jgi:hypothetical protein
MAYNTKDLLAKAKVAGLIFPTFKLPTLYLATL